MWNLSPKLNNSLVSGCCCCCHSQQNFQTNAGNDLNRLTEKNLESNLFFISGTFWTVQHLLVSSSTRPGIRVLCCSVPGSRSSLHQLDQLPGAQGECTGVSWHDALHWVVGGEGDCSYGWRVWQRCPGKYSTELQHFFRDNATDPLTLILQNELVKLNKSELCCDWNHLTRDVSEIIWSMEFSGANNSILRSCQAGW